MSAQPQSFSFTATDLKIREVPVALGEANYVLREASEDAAVTYRNASMSKAKVADGKVIGVAGIADVEPLLVGLCLFASGSDTPVGEEFVRRLPSRVVKPLYQWVIAESGLLDKDNETGKDAPNGTNAS